MADALVIDDGDTSTGSEVDDNRSTTPFRLSDRLDEIAQLVVSATVPVKKSHWKRSVIRRWARVREEFRTKSPGSQKLYISKFRKAVKDALEVAEEDRARATMINDEVKAEILVFEPELMEEVEAEQKARVRRYSTNLTPFPDWEAALTELQMLLRHTDPELIAVGLMAVTGRRMTEVLSAGTFGPVTQVFDGETGVRGKVTQKYLVGFHGQMKTREAEGTRHDQWYNIPVLADGREVLDAVRRLHDTEKGQSWKDQDSARLNNTANTPLNRALHSRRDLISLWPQSEIESTERGERLSLKFLRAFYAEVAFHYFAKDEETKHGFFHRVLGHADDDYRSSMSYMRYSLGRTISKADKQEIKRLSEELKTAEARRGKDET